MRDDATEIANLILDIGQVRASVLGLDDLFQLLILEETLIHTHGRMNANPACRKFTGLAAVNVIVTAFCSSVLRQTSNNSIFMLLNVFIYLCLSILYITGSITLGIFKEFCELFKSYIFFLLKRYNYQMQYIIFC